MEKKVNCRGVEYDDRTMERARMQTKISVLMQAMSTLARSGHEDFVKETLKQVDEAVKNVHPDDLYDPSKMNLN